MEEKREGGREGGGTKRIAEEGGGHDKEKSRQVEAGK